MEITAEEKHEGGYKVISYEITPEKDFEINEDHLDRHLCAMGRILTQYGDLYAKLKAELSRKEDNLKEVAAKVGILLRAEAEEKGVKTTEGKIHEQVLAHPDYRKALDDLNDVRYRAYHAEAFWKTANQVSNLIYSLSFKQASEIKKGTF